MTTRLSAVFLGDVHGDLDRCREVCAHFPDVPVIQLGDLAVGTAEMTRTAGGILIPTRQISLSLLDTMPSNFFFFPGNHDNRQVSLASSKCLGNFGEFNGCFFVSGAFSVDRDTRIEGVDWWSDEELSILEGYQAVEAWKKSRCEVLISHEGPREILYEMFRISDKTRTSQLLQALLEARRPRLWIFGHHHRSIKFTEGKTTFICLAIGEAFRMAIPSA